MVGAEYSMCSSSVNRDQLRGPGFYKWLNLVENLEHTRFFTTTPGDTSCNSVEAVADAVEMSQYVYAQQCYAGLAAEWR